MLFASGIRQQAVIIAGSHRGHADKHITQMLEWVDAAAAAGCRPHHARLVMFVEAGTADMERFHSILSRHSLLEAWAKFEHRFLKS